MNNDLTHPKTVLIIGATGYIGSAVVAEAVRRGYHTIAVTRSAPIADQFPGAEIVQADVTDPAAVARAFDRKVDVVISCLGCHSGLASDFFKIDYEATLHVLNAALANGTQQFILLSAICVRQPELPLQLAKLKMEDELMRSGIDYTIVRPTAYFWVFDVQTRMILKGRPGMLISGGEQARHNPIAKEDLADFMVGAIDNEERRNRVFVIGGPQVPDNIISSRSSLEMLFEALGKKPKLLSVPNWLIVATIRLTGWLGVVFRKLGVFSEFLKIIYYYETNDMLAPGYGTITFRQHINARVRELEAKQVN
jgi:divinyl chlorophyllide a 8-vinyl-reductase